MPESKQPENFDELENIVQEPLGDIEPTPETEERDPDAADPVQSEIDDDTLRALYPDKDVKNHDRSPTRLPKWGLGGNSLLTDEIEEKILKFLKTGCYIETAVGAAGISKATFYNWMKQANAGDKRYKSFLDAVVKARHEADLRDVTIIAKAAEKQWQAAAWKQERKNPKQWGRKDFQQQQVSIDMSKETESRLNSIFQRAVKEPE